MKLYYKPGACSLAAHIALIEVGLGFSLEQADTVAGTTETGALFSRISPNGYVPALETASGDIFTENPAVLQYIADLAPASGLAPAAGTTERVRLQEVLNFLSSELHKAFGPFFSGRELNTADRDAASAGVLRRAAHVERILADGRDHLLGGGFTVADAYAFVILNWAGFIGLSLAELPLTQSYVERIRARASAQQAMRREGLIPQEDAA